MVAIGESELDVVTGAFGYTGKYITRRLLMMGRRVITLTGHPGNPNIFDGKVRACGYNFDEPEALISSLKGVNTLYNTYWVRFPYGSVTYEQALNNTRTLIKSAQAAGVKRIVHVSVSNPSIDSVLPYFRGKAQLEDEIQHSGLSYAIIRPTVIFGKDDILINNIAYLLRRFPIFAIPGSGEYRLQPIYVEDMAEITVRAGQATENMILDAVGPEVFSFIELVDMIAEKVASRAMLVHVPPWLALFLSRLVGFLVRDVVLTQAEVEGLMAELLVSKDPPTGKTSLSEWLELNKASIGVKYASELRRHYV